MAPHSPGILTAACSIQFYALRLTSSTIQYPPVVSPLQTACLFSPLLLANTLSSTTHRYRPLLLHRNSNFPPSACRLAVASTTTLPLSPVADCLSPPSLLLSSSPCRRLVICALSRLSAVLLSPSLTVAPPALSPLCRCRRALRTSPPKSVPTVKHRSPSLRRSLADSAAVVIPLARLRRLISSAYRQTSLTIAPPALSPTLPRRRALSPSLPSDFECLPSDIAHHHRSVCCLSALPSRLVAASPAHFRRFLPLSSAVPMRPGRKCGAPLLSRLVGE